jgi:hypothetical protein
MKRQVKKIESREVVIIPNQKELRADKIYREKYLQNYVFKEVENKCEVRIGPIKILQIDYVIKKITDRQMSAIDSKNFFCSFFRLEDTVNHFSSLGLTSVVAKKIKQVLETGCVVYVEEKTGDMHIRPGTAGNIFTDTAVIFKAFEPFFKPKKDRPKPMEYQIEGAKIVKKTNFKNKEKS